MNKTNKKNRAVVFVTDAGFLVPTLVTAHQLAASRMISHADIIVYLIDIPPPLLMKLENAFRSDGLKFHPLETRSFVPSAGVHFRKGHVPVASLARLVLAEYIPSHYDHVLYLDGDTQIVGDVGLLLNYDVPQGKIAAVNGSIWLRAGADGKLHTKDENYLLGLNNLSANDYFNCGVLAFRRDSWGEIGAEALHFFNANSRSCHHHDQSALNAVCKGKRVALAPGYNFHSEYAKLFVWAQAKPRVVHFTGNNKPWLYPVMPWGDGYAEPYRQLIVEHGFLSEYLKVPPAMDPPRAILRNAKKAVHLLADAKTTFSQRARFLGYMKKESFAF